MKLLANISRILVGLVFIFSGFVKGIDPLGTAYRIEDYFIAFGTTWAIPLALFMAISLCALEFTLGVSVLLNLRVKITAWPLLLMMVFFTGLTLNDAINNPVPDCGCFGDAITLSNWATFYKNIVLIVLVFIIFIYRKKYQPWLMPKPGNLAVLIVFLAFGLFSFIEYIHLPMIDFLPWKVGKDMVPDNPGKPKVYLTYRNINTGETKEYLSPDYPWNDSLWVKEWVFVDQRIDDSHVIKGHTLHIFDNQSNEVTEDFINNPGYQFLVISWDLSESSRKGMEKLDRLFADVSARGHSFVVLTSSPDETIEAYRQGLHPELEFYHADDVELKMMVRANPGMILLKDGMVLGKWNWRDVPDLQHLQKKFADL
jgi:uncharacterized membrane protein YphA (DoxX/SURF4 family)